MQYRTTLPLDLYQNYIFFLLSTCPDELLSAMNIITFLANPLPSDNEKIPRVSHPLPYPEYLCLSKSAFLVNSATPNKEFSNVKLTLCLNGHK